MNGTQIRSTFLNFFKSKGHTIVPSASLIPQGDATLLFTNAGMNQFKDCFLGGEKREYSRATTSQKCLRISGKHNDFENVGVTARHHTFFEMLGNFSFGDYFKADAISFAWELLTKVYGIDPKRLWITISEKDTEARNYWKELIASDRIVGLPEKDIFWQMGDTGPCGPCSEIYYYLGSDTSRQSEAELRAEDPAYLEIWNLVFMQFNRDSSGVLTPLPKPAIDTGMGLERIAAVLQGKSANYDCDLLREIISVTEKLSGYTYDGSSYKARNPRTDISYARDIAMRVIADHSRAATFMIADGVLPASEGRGYVLRRVIRRAIRHSRVLNIREPFFVKTAGKVIELFETQYPEVREQRSLIEQVVNNEELKFNETLDAGLKILNEKVAELSPQQPFPGETAFLLHDTYGFPLDLTQDALKAYQKEVDTAAFTRAMEAQKERSREDRKAQGITFVSRSFDGAKTNFIGYEALQGDGKVIEVIPGEQSNQVQLLVDTTPFYAESGGQVGDQGEITIQDNVIKVWDTQKVQGGYYLHSGELIRGAISPKLKGERAHLSVDAERRAKIRANHSATHLVHAALRSVLGAHVKQAGSRVDDQSLRFDYSHFSPLTEDQVIEIQTQVNQEIRANHQVTTREMAIEDAKKTGAMALFGEKYGDKVRVVEIGPGSLELCGGTHVGRSGDIGVLLFGSDTGVAAGVRRIECWSGTGAHEQLLKERAERLAIAALLKSDTHNLPEKLEKVLGRQRDLERELDAAKSKLAGSATQDLVKNSKLSPKGVKVIVEKVKESDTDTLRTMVDRLRLAIGSGVVALASNQGEKAVIVAGVTPDLVKSISAGDLVREAAKVSGGRGGGRPDFAQAGGVDPSKLDAALEKLFQLVL